jgi:NTE family protein
VNETAPEPSGAELEAARRDPLASPALGTATDDLIHPCEEEYRHEPLPAVKQEPAFALAFSGGGFRATFTALGVLRFLADAQLLARVRFVSSVSGGSIANGLFAHAYPHLEEAGFAGEALDRQVLAPATAKVAGSSLQRSLLLNLWRALSPRKTRTDLLADHLDSWFFQGLRLADLSANCRFIFNAANLTSGVRFQFDREYLGDYVLGHIATSLAPMSIRLADAVAASAAFPGALAPVVLEGYAFPCAHGRTAKLLDGGAYDNLGLEALDDMPETCLVACNAGGTFRTGRFGWLPLVRDLKRTNSLLYRQTNVLRMRTMVERFRAYEQARDAGVASPDWARQGVVFSLATTLAADRASEWRRGRDERAELRIPLALTATALTKFSEERCHQLVYRGWWLAGATLSEFHRQLLPAELPPWRPLPGTRP